MEVARFKVWALPGVTREKRKQEEEEDCLSSERSHWQSPLGEQVKAPKDAMKKKKSRQKKKKKLSKESITEEAQAGAPAVVRAPVRSRAPPA